MSSNSTDPGLFERAIEFPDAGARERFDALVGLDEQKQSLVKMLSSLAHRSGVKEWLKKHHPGAHTLAKLIERRPPLVILAGDVGSGKTELAETVGDVVARQEKIDVVLYPLSLSARGRGLVGEMSSLLSAAFDRTVSAAKKLRDAGGNARGAIILLIDEADALAQSREASQMHHEDRAGVNTLIRGIDRISNEKLPAAVIMCTNRLSAIDPAIQRRAAATLVFARPNQQQREHLLSLYLSDLGFTHKEIQTLAAVTGDNKERGYGFTYSDLTQRLIPEVVFDAYPKQGITFTRALQLAQSLQPTPPFRDGAQ